MLSCLNNLIELASKKKKKKDVIRHQELRVIWGIMDNSQEYEQKFVYEESVSNFVWVDFALLTKLFLRSRLHFEQP